MTTLGLVLAAVEEAEETSKTAFYVAGGALAVFAVLLATLGLTQPEFPRSRGAFRAVCGVMVLLVAAAVGTAIATG